MSATVAFTVLFELLGLQLQIYIVVVEIWSTYQLIAVKITWNLDYHILTTELYARHFTALILFARYLEQSVDQLNEQLELAINSVHFVASLLRDVNKSL